MAFSLEKAIFCLKADFIFVDKEGWYPIKYFHFKPIDYVEE